MNKGCGEGLSTSGPGLAYPGMAESPLPMCSNPPAAAPSARPGAVGIRPDLAEAIDRLVALDALPTAARQPGCSCCGPLGGRPQ